MKESRKDWLKTSKGKEYKRRNQREYRRRKAKQKIHKLTCECSMCKHYKKTRERNPLRGK